MSKYFKPIRTISVQELADLVGAVNIVGDKSAVIEGITTLSLARQNDLSFFDNAKYIEHLEKTTAGFCLIKAELTEKAPKHLTLIVVEEPYIAYAMALNILYPLCSYEPYKASSASIHSTAKLGSNVHISENVYIGANVKLGDSCYIGPNSCIYDNVEIGDNCTIYSNVSIKCASLGNFCIIHDGVRIGQDGFGFASSPKVGVIKINHIGGVIIGNSVEVGANTTIDRAVADNTEIGDFTKIDNLVQIGHNTKIGKYCFLAGLVGIAGSCVIEDFVQLGGNAGVAPHITVLKGTQVAPKSGVAKTNSKENEVLMGAPAMPFHSFWKLQALFKRMLNSK